MKKIILTVVLFFCCYQTPLPAQIDAQWRGLNRTGHYNNEKLLKSWPEKGPALLATIDFIGEGYSSPSVTSDRIYITGMEDGTGYLFCFNLQAKLLWKKAYGDEWDSSYPGARSTPTVVGDKIYFTSSLGVVYCFNSQGKKVWSLDMTDTFNAPNLRWGMVESPAIDGNYIFCTPGADDVSVAVLNRHTGKIIKEIEGNGQESAYCSPAIINHNGRKIFLTMLAESIIGIDLQSLRMIFEHEHITDYDINPNTPLYHKGYIYIVSGYGTGGQLLKLSNDGSKVNRVWKNAKLDSQKGAVVLHNGYLYGSGHDNRNWHCLNFMTGETQYEARELGRMGTIICADNMLYIYSEKGDIGLVKPNNTKFEVVSSFKLTQGSGQHWAHPVIKDGRLYVRHGNVLNIYNIEG